MSFSQPASEVCSVGIKLKLLIAVIQINECIETVDFNTEINRAVFQSFNA
jgi:hypothetical protein